MKFMNLIALFYYPFSWVKIVIQIDFQHTTNPNTFVILTEVHIGVICRIHLMIGPDPIHPNTCFMGFINGDK